MVKRYSFDIDIETEPVFDYYDNIREVTYLKEIPVEDGNNCVIEYEDKEGEWVKYEDYKKLVFILNKYVKKYGYNTFKN